MPWEKQFDIEATLEKAGEAFWARGYEATSLRDLLEAMGIQKGSFYNTYGSKHEIYLKALEQYTNARLEEFKTLTSERGALESLKVLFDALVEDCLSPTGHRGCMVINCALEVAHEDEEARAIVQRSIGRHEGLMRDLIEAGQQAGEIGLHLDAAATAKAMMAIVMGMRVYSRSGSDPSAVHVLAEQAMALVAPPTI